MGVISMADSSAAKNFDFGKNIISEWKGYNSSYDKTAVAQNVYVKGSQNIYKKLSGVLAVRQGQKRLGVANTIQSEISSEFVWNTSWGATYVLVISNSTLYVVVNNVWYVLQASLTKTRYVFDKWWDNSLKQDVCLFVNGTSNIYKWNGGFGLISSTTANTIVLDRTITASFLTAASGSVVVNGTTYTYSGSSGSTLTGVSPNPTGEANGSGVLQVVATTSNSPASGFNNDFIKVINNQLYVGSYTSRLLYISSNTDYTNFTEPNPRLAGSPAIRTMDSTLNGIGIKGGNPHVSIGTGEWAVLTFSDITVGTTLTNVINVDVKPVAKLAAAYAHEFIANNGDNLVYLAKDQQVRTFGNFNDSFVNAYPSLSQEISTELMEENFTGGGLKCIGDFTYLTAPVSGKTYLLQERQSVDPNNRVVIERLWHSPFIWNATRVDELSGEVIVFSNANPQIYEVWNTNQWFDDSPSGEQLPYSCVLALSYRPGGLRQGLISFDKYFSEGYLTPGTPLNLTINYNYEGATGQIIAPINSQARPAYIFNASAGSLGDNTPGDKPMGDDIDVDDTNNNELSKFKVINSLALVNCFEFQPTYSSDTANAQWEILASGGNVHEEPDARATFIINKQRT